MNFEELFQDFSIDLINHNQFLLNALIAAFLCWILGKFYKTYGASIGNRSAFSENFILLCLTTMLIIYIVKSSIALSLGLVGALSIVRFRAAIKEPEELAYLFLSIAIGIGMGANQAGITILAFVLILAIMILKVKTSKKASFNIKSQILLNISTDEISEKEINSTLIKTFKAVELRRMSQKNNKLYMTYIVEFEKFEKISEVKTELFKLAPALEFSIIDNRNLST